MAFTTYLAVLIALMAASIAIVLWVTESARAIFRYRGKMLFTCPENGKPVAVRVAILDAARSALTGRPKIHLSECSRWPEMQNCGQECLSQLGADPHSCLVWTKVSDWYRGRSCVFCQKPFGEIHWHDHPPALMAPDHKTFQWNEVPPEKLPEIFETYRPVCWSCHIAEAFRRQCPERVLDRPGHRGPIGELLTEHKKPPVSPMVH